MKTLARLSIFILFMLPIIFISGIAESAEIHYVVKKDNTLWKIAARHQVDIKQLYRMNKKVIGDNPDLILPGQVLRLPVIDHYVVRKHDTLWKIAKRLQVKTSELYRLNKAIIGDNPDLIQPKQILSNPRSVGLKKIEPSEIIKVEPLPQIVEPAAPQPLVKKEPPPIKKEIVIPEPKSQPGFMEKLKLLILTVGFRLIALVLAVSLLLLLIFLYLAHRSHRNFVQPALHHPCAAKNKGSKIYVGSFKDSTWISYYILEGANCMVAQKANLVDAVSEATGGDFTCIDFSMPQDFDVLNTFDIERESIILLTMEEQAELEMKMGLIRSPWKDFRTFLRKWHTSKP